jgi:DNA gyrase subunit A
MEVGLVRSINIDQEMQQAYLDYAMSVIVSRALPDARDGLKPVHRRILYAMYDMGMRPDTPYKKSARIVGEVLGKYHPHGDMAVYEAMARMAQPFSLRTLLIDGQGNFGSIDGDPPAAMRYTEARLAPPAMNMLADIQKNTVDFSENFDGTLTQPDVLPAALPNLLVNGATGIAVGMSTSIPPHNLGEVVDALVMMLQRWDQLDDISVEELMQSIKGPDFPTGGIIVSRDDQEGLKSAYGTGRGRVTVQARAHFEEMSRGRNRIIVTELPYMTNKSTLIERIAELVRDERLDGIADLRDESDRQGLRIVIELNKTADPTRVLQDLFKGTSMRTTFGIIMLALVEGEPRMLSLKQALRFYLEHRLIVVKRRSQHDLERARHRAHILEGLRIALKNLDDVIAIIRKSPDAETAKERLMKRYKLSDIQAQAILDLPLRRLAALERRKIEDEYKEVTALIKSLESLLRSPKKMREVVAEELLAVKEAYADRRRTQIVHLTEGDMAEVSFVASDMAPEQQVWVSVTAEGLLSRSLEDTAPPTAGSAAPRWALRVSTRDTLYLVSDKGDAAGLPIHALPETGDISAGVPAHKVSALSGNDRLATLFTLPGKDDRPEGSYVFSGTRRGYVKKTAVSELPGATAKTFNLMKVNEEDSFLWARITDGNSEVLLATAEGMAIRFSEEDVRPMGLGAAGVVGIKLQGRDEVVGGDLIEPEGDVLLVASNGRAKRVSAEQFPRQGRYGQGVVAWKLPRPDQLIGTALASKKNPAPGVTLYLDKKAPKALRWSDAPAQTRAAAGKTVIDLKGGEQIIGITVPFDQGRAPAAEPPAAEKGAPSRKRPAAVKASPSIETPPTNGKKTRATKANPLQAVLPLDDSLSPLKKPSAKKSAVQEPAPKAGKGKSGTASTAKAAGSKTATRKGKAGAAAEAADSVKKGTAQKTPVTGKTGSASVKKTPAKKAAGEAPAEAPKRSPSKKTPAKVESEEKPAAAEKRKPSTGKAAANKEAASRKTPSSRSKKS